MKPVARATNLRVKPMKMVRAASRVRGMPVGEAIHFLQSQADRASRLLLDLVRQAVANAEHNMEIPSGALAIESVQVGRGVAMRRWRAQPRGMAHPYRKATANVEVLLGERG